jgi:hypothetical protein
MAETQNSPNEKLDNVLLVAHWPMRGVYAANPNKLGEAAPEKL